MKLNLTALILILFCSVCVAHPERIEVRLLKVNDGDSIKVDIPNWPAIVGDDIGVRVVGVDTPELRAKCLEEKALAIEAKAFVLVTLRNADSIWIENPRRDKYFRILADVYVDGVKLSDMLIENDLGVPYEGGRRRSWCYD